MATSAGANEGPRPEPKPRSDLVQTTDHFHHVRVRPKESFVELRTPSEDAEVAREVIGAGCDVRKGRLDAGTWLVESVLVPRYAAGDGAEAESLTDDLLARIES